MLVLRVIGQLRDAGRAFSKIIFPVFIPTLTRGNLERGAFVECGEGQKGRGKIFPDIGERHHHMILSGLRALEGMFSLA